MEEDRKNYISIIDNTDITASMSHMDKAFQERIKRTQVARPPHPKRNETATNIKSTVPSQKKKDDRPVLEWHDASSDSENDRMRIEAMN